MSKNWKFGNIGNGVTLPLEVDAKAAAGDVTHIGAADSGLYAYLVTPPATSDGPNAPGLKEGYASARLLPTEAVIELEVAGSPANGTPVYSKVGSTAVEYTTVGAATNYHVGHVVEPQDQTPSTGKVFVYLGTATGAAGGGA